VRKKEVSGAAFIAEARAPWAGAPRPRPMGGGR
jgi:hypothetical protein